MRKSLHCLVGFAFLITVPQFSLAFSHQTLFHVSVPLRVGEERKDCDIVGTLMRLMGLFVTWSVIWCPVISRSKPAFI